MTTLRTELPRRHGAQSASAKRGFTLVELMVSLTGGLFLSIVVFALARDGQRFYQRESRLANATLAGIAGFDRLRADIARAGFLTSPNVNADPRLCSRPDQAVPWPAQLGTLRSVTVDTPSTVPTALANNGITPHRILLAGSYASTEEFPIRTLSVSQGGAQQIFLQVSSGPMARLGYVTAPNAAKQALLASVFGTGRAIRMVDREGMQHYAVVASVDGGDNPAIALAPNPAITLRSGAAKQCGAKGFETGATVNVVNFIRYEVASMSGNANYTRLFTLSAAAPGENQRTELVRTEIDAAGVAIAGTQELVAEYAVDLRFGLTGVTGVVGTNPTIGAIAPGDFATFAGAAGNAQRLRAVRARLSVRSREPDREATVNAGPTVAAGLYRFRVAPAQLGVPTMARVRTFQADIALHNHTRLLW